MATLRMMSSPGCFPTYIYDVFYYSDTITTTVTGDPVAVNQWITEVKLIYSGSPKINIIGFDTKCLLPYGPGPNQTATVNLCIGNRCLIYQLLHTNFIPRSLIEFFPEAKFAFASIGVQPRLQRLMNDHQLANDVKWKLDLGSVVASRYDLPELATAGLKSLASVVLGKEIDTPQYLVESDWNALCLTPEQVQYACVEAFVSWQIANALINPAQP